MLGTIIDQFNTKYDEVIKKIKKSDEQKRIINEPLLYSYQSYHTYVQTNNENGTTTIKKKSVITENGKTKKSEELYVKMPDGNLIDISNQLNQLNKTKSKYKLKKITY
jgi:hypothetical protein